MSVKQVFAVTALAFVGSAALADEAPTVPLTRAEVVQSVLAARAAGTLMPAGASNYSPGYAKAGDYATSNVTRAQAQTQVLQARANGTLLAAGDADPGYPIAGDTTSTLSRSEVLADLQIYRESGLADLNRGEATDTSSPARARAQAKYAQLRGSPYYATLVQRIEANGEGS